MEQGFGKSLTICSHTLLLYIQTFQICVIFKWMFHNLTQRIKFGYLISVTRRPRIVCDIMNNRLLCNVHDGLSRVEVRGCRANYQDREQAKKKIEDNRAKE